MKMNKIKSEHTHTKKLFDGNNPSKNENCAIIWRIPQVFSEFPIFKDLHLEDILSDLFKIKNKY